MPFGSSTGFVPMLEPMRQFLRAPGGVTSIEYALIASLIALVIITAVGTLGTSLSTTFSAIASAIP